MKRGYKRLLIFEIIVFIILFLNSFVWNILYNYNLALFTLGLLLIFKFIFGYEKDNHRYIKDIILDIIIYLITFFVLYYLLGIIVSFYKADYYSMVAFRDIVIPVAFYLVVKEIFRYMVLCKAEGSKLLTVITVLMFIMLDTTYIYYSVKFASTMSVFKFIALSLMPAISENIALSYTSRKVGYRPNIVYLLIIKLYKYLFVIVPNPGEYITAVIEFLLPAILGYIIYSAFKKDMDEDIRRDYHKKHLLSLIVPVIITMVLVYFTSGYFHFHAVSVASGSMAPNINKGDAVVIEKIDGKYEKLKEKQVIAFKHEKEIIIHRIVNIVKLKDEYCFYTKGDANTNMDNFAVKESEIIGIVNVKIPLIGWPTVWVNEL